jgi:hypothetical protein
MKAIYRIFRDDQLVKLKQNGPPQESHPCEMKHPHLGFRRRIP